VISVRSPFALLVVLQAAGAGGQPAPAGTPASARPAPATEIAVVGAPANLEWVRALMRPGGTDGVPLHWSRLDHFDPRDVLRTAGAASEALHCWIDLTDAKRARIYFAARSGERFLIRDLDLSGAFDELDRATLAEVLDLSLLALIEDDRAGLSRAETETLLARRTAAKAAATIPPGPAPAIPPPSPAGLPPPPGPRVGVFYAGQGFSTELPIVQGPGLFLSWGLPAADRSRRQLAAWLSVQYQLPADDQAGPVGLRLQTVTPRAGIQVRFPPGLDARLGLGADLSHLTPQAGTAGAMAMLTPPRWSESLLLTAAVGTAVPLTRRVEIEALVFADYLPTAVDYDLSVGGQTSTVVSSFRLRPGIALELMVR
jgi:hypothetical protein